MGKEKSKETKKEERNGDSERNETKRTGAIRRPRCGRPLASLRLRVSQPPGCNLIQGSDE